MTRKTSASFELARRLSAAKVVGLTFLVMLGQLLVDDPDGYFGPADTMTSAGALFMGLALSLGAAVALLSRQGHAAVAWLAPLYFALCAGSFVPSLGADPVVSGLVVLWPLWLIIAQVFRLDHLQLGEMSGPRSGSDSGTDLERWQRYGGTPLRHLTGMALLLSLIVVGFEISTNDLAFVLCGAMHAIALLASWRMWWLLLRARSLLVTTLVVPVVAVVVARTHPAWSLGVLSLYQLTVLAFLYSKGSVMRELFGHFVQRPALLVLSTFAGLIGAGTVALRFPAASAGADPVSAIDALFTAASAVCITGLIVLDTPVDFSFFGHVVILVLIQVGGLGIMVLSTFASLLLAGSIGLRNERALSEVMNLRSPEAAYKLTRFIVVATLGIEAIGALILYPYFVGLGHAPLQATWHAVFHAVSAFCNAGFALQSDSVTVFANEPVPLLVLSGLIFLGGLGFVVMSGLWMLARNGFKGSLNLQARIILWATLFLNLSAIVWIGGLEWNNTLAHLQGTDRVVNAFFMGVSMRTAGFNSIDTELLGPATVMICLVYMYIGGSPGSTAGGIKNTTAVILLAAIPAIARGETRVVIGGRTIAQANVYRSAAIAAVTMVIAFATCVFLMATQTGGFEALLFEAVSATGTVGLSMGATADLNTAGKAWIAVVMFIGRTGPLTLAILLTRESPSRLRYPETTIMVG